MEDNHLFGEDSEIAEGATEKMITGGGGALGGIFMEGGENWVERFADRFFWGKKNGVFYIIRLDVFKDREIVLEMCIG